MKNTGAGENMLEQKIELPRRCGTEYECILLCDFCIHFQMFKTKSGGNLDGSGYCGLHRKIVSAESECNKFYCRGQWEKDIKEWNKTQQGGIFATFVERLKQFWKQYAGPIYLAASAIMAIQGLIYLIKWFTSPGD